MTTSATYFSWSARDAAEFNYGDESYWAYLDRSAFEKAQYYTRKGDPESAERMFTRGLSEALKGNNGL